MKDEELESLLSILDGAGAAQNIKEQQGLEGLEELSLLLFDHVRLPAEELFDLYGALSLFLPMPFVRLLVPVWCLCLIGRTLELPLCVLLLVVW